MHPNTFLRAFWRTEFRPEVFVAMSFDPIYQDRFEHVFEPAIEAIGNAGRKLTASRVDLSRSGDSILTDIADGVAHAQLVLADVSTVGRDSKNGRPYRNGNVMYEVGLALAARQPSEVLLIRDDRDPFLFDVSTVPHRTIDFADPAQAREQITQALEERIGETQTIRDARVELALRSLTSAERQLLETFAAYPPPQRFWLKRETLAGRAGIARLLDKGLLVAVGLTEDSRSILAWTPIGYSIASKLDALMPRLDTASATSNGES